MIGFYVSRTEFLWRTSCIRISLDRAEALKYVCFRLLLCFLHENEVRRTVFLTLFVI